MANGKSVIYIMKVNSEFMTYKFAMLDDIQFCGYCHFYIKSKKSYCTKE